MTDLTLVNLLMMEDGAKPIGVDVLNLSTRKTQFGLTTTLCGRLVGITRSRLYEVLTTAPKPMFVKVNNYLIRTSIESYTWPVSLEDKRVKVLTMHPRQNEDQTP